MNILNFFLGAAIIYCFLFLLSLSFSIIVLGIKNLKLKENSVFWFVLGFLYVCWYWAS